MLEEKIESTDSAISEQEFAPTTQQADLSEPVLEDQESPEQVLLRQKSSLKLQQIKLW